MKRYDVSRLMLIKVNLSPIAGCWHDSCRTGPFSVNLEDNVSYQTLILGEIERAVLPVIKRNNRYISLD